MADVDFNEDGSCWAAMGGGRKRWFPKKHRVTIALRKSLTLDKLKDQIESTDVVKGGYYQRTVYYRDEDNKICIPPDPAMIPEGREPITIRNIAEAKALQKEMSAELRSQFSGDAEATRYLDEAQGNPMDFLKDILRNPKSNYERDMVHCMLQSLEREQRDRETIEAEATLYWLGTN